MLVESVVNPKPIDLYDLVYEYAPKLANGAVVLPVPDPWFKALVMALEEQLNAAHAKQEAKIEALQKDNERLHLRVLTLRGRINEMRHAGQDE